jgi:hypothetical protein
MPKNRKQIARRKETRFNQNEASAREEAKCKLKMEIKLKQISTRVSVCFSFINLQVFTVHQTVEITVEMRSIYSRD